MQFWCPPSCNIAWPLTFGKFLVHAWQQMTVGAERDVDGGRVDISRKDVTR